jgi:hypothetical protein
VLPEISNESIGSAASAWARLVGGEGEEEELGLCKTLLLRRSSVESSSGKKKALDATWPAVTHKAVGQLNPKMPRWC